MANKQSWRLHLVRVLVLVAVLLRPLGDMGALRGDPEPNQAPVVAVPLDDVAASVGDANKVVDLVPHFSDPDVPGTVVRFDTVLGPILVELFNTAAPLTVANFLQYLNDGDYSGSVIHRSVPNFVLQGGGYWYPGWSKITRHAAVVNEFGISNTRGTLAMAKTEGDPNSATSEWFVNLGDNSGNLDVQNGGFTVFGRVIGDGMAVVDALAAIPTYDFGFSPWTELPLLNYTDYPYEPAAENVVMVYDIAVSSPLTFTVTNDNPGLLSAAISNARLTLQYQANQRGTAHLTVRATDEGGLWVEDSFTVEVRRPPVAQNDKATVQEDEATPIAVLANDTAPDLAIDPASVTVVAAPAHGTAVANPATGAVLYTPAADYYGADTFTYKVADSGGRRSNVATVTVAVNAKPVVVAPIANVVVEMGSSPAAVDLSQVFTDVEVRGHIARFDTTLGQFEVELRDAQAPRTVANFRKYVADGDYTSTLIHRVVSNFVIQGGGYGYPSWEHVPEDAAIANEFGASNVRGTLAMAKVSGNPNSATSEWFLNLVDNSATLDGQNGGYTVFGRVLGDGMSVVDAIAAVPTYAFSNPYDQLPLRNYTSFPATPVQANVILVNAITVRPALTYTIILDTPGGLLLNPTITDNTLNLDLRPDQWGTGTVTVRATDMAGGSVETTFQVTVNGPPLANDDSPQVDPNVATAIPVLLNDLARGRAIDPTTVAIVTAPQYGTAVVNPATGVVAYTPPAGFVGPDPFTYRVRDIAGGPSNVATVQVVTNAAGYLIGTGHPGSLRYTDPDGTTVTVAVASGVARVRFVGYPQLVSQTATQIVVGGQSVSLHRIEMVQSTTTTAVTFTTTGGTVPGATLGGFLGSAPVGQLSGATMDMVGEGIAMTGAGYITTTVLRDLRQGADILMAGTGATNGVSLTLRNIPDPGTDIRLGSTLASLTLAQWAGSTLVAPSAKTITVKGNTALALPGNLGANISLTRVTAGQSTLGTITVAGRITGGRWDIAGTVGTITTGTSAAGWTLAATGKVTTLNATDLGGTLSAFTFGSVKVSREMTAVLTATDPNPAHVSLATLSAAKVNGARVTVPGSITTVSVSEWKGGQLNAAWISSLTTTANTAQNLKGELIEMAMTLSGAGNPAKALPLATFAGKLTKCTWTINGHVGTVKAKMVDQLDCLVLGNLASFTFVQVTASNLSVVGKITTLSGTQWDGGSVYAKSLATLKITGDAIKEIHGNFFTNLTLTGEGVGAGQLTLGNANISYAIGYAEWDITGSVGPISAYIVQDWKVRVRGAAQAMSLTYVTRGEVTVDGTPTSITSSQWAGGKIGAGSLPQAKLGVVSNLNVTVTNAIGAVEAVYWLGGSISAKNVRQLTTTGLGAYGDFSPNITLTGNTGVVETLANLKVARRVLGGTWTITGNVGTVDVFSLFQGCKVKATGNIRSLAVGAAVNSVVHAGVASGITGLPSTAADFTSATASIQKFLVRGVPLATATHSFINSILAAPVLGPTTVLTVRTANGGTPFGFAARTFQSLTRKEGATTYTWPTNWPSDTGDLRVVVVPAP